MDDNNGNNTAKKGGGFRCLGPFLKYFSGVDLMVELKNGKIYKGELHDSDDYMNLILFHAHHFVPKNIRPNSSSSSRYDFIFHPTQSQLLDTSEKKRDQSMLPSTGTDESSGSTKLQDSDYQLLHIRGPSIRYIHFPGNADLPRMIKAGQERERLARQKYTRHKMRPKARPP